jgi:hypothetical protein
LIENPWDMEFDETWPIASVVHLIEGKKFQANVGQEFGIFFIYTPCSLV